MPTSSPRLCRIAIHCAALAFAVLLAVAPAWAADGTPMGGGTAHFDVGGLYSDLASAVAVLPDGKVLVVGTVDIGNDVHVLALARFLPGGALDTSFDVDGKLVDPFAGGANVVIAGVHVLAGGGILVAGSYVYSVPGDADFFVARLLANGQPDPTFGSSGQRIVAFDMGGSFTDLARAMAVDKFGRIVVVGSVDVSATDVDIGVIRLTAAGDLDPSFSTYGATTIPISTSDPDHGLAVAVGRDGRIIVGGASWNSLVALPNFDAFVAVLLDNGSLDTTFGSAGKFVFVYSTNGNKNDFCWAVGVWPDGEIVTAGDYTLDVDTWRWFALRIAPDGASWDSMVGVHCATSNGPCAHPPQDTVRALLLQPDGKVVLAGSGLSAPGSVDFGVSRVTRDFFPDHSFAGDSTTLFDFSYGVGSGVDLGSALAFDHDGRLIVAGSIEFNGFDTDFGWVRLDSSYVFADGFEWGSTAKWSSAP